MATEFHAARVLSVSFTFFPPAVHEQCYNIPYLSLNMFLGGDQKDRDSATAYSKRVTPYLQAKQNAGEDFPSASLLSLSLFSPRLCPGMSAELVSMLLASVIQGQVMALYNTERQESCQPLDPVHETPESTSPPQTASLQETVETEIILIFLWQSSSIVFGIVLT